MKKSYLLYTKPRQEKLALQHLQNQAYEVYLPMIQVEKIRQGMKGLVEKGLFLLAIYLCAWMRQVRKVGHRFARPPAFLSW
jgi:hypothetical protein